MTSKTTMLTQEKGKLERFPDYPPREDMQNWLHLYDPGVLTSLTVPSQLAMLTEVLSPQTRPAAPPQSSPGLRACPSGDSRRRIPRQVPPALRHGFVALRQDVNGSCA